jgi:hypothetical protein
MTFRWRHECPSDSSEEGLTLIEMSIGTAVMLVVLLPFFGFLLGIMKNEAASISHSTTGGSVRIVMQSVQNDLQAANPLTTTPASGSTSSSVVFKLGPSSGSQQTITWAVSSGKLTRTVGSSAAVTKLTGVTSATPFTYYSPNGPFQTGEAASCATRINVTLVVSRGTGWTPYRDQIDVELNNVPPGNQTTCH